MHFLVLATISQNNSLQTTISQNNSLQTTISQNNSLQTTISQNNSLQTTPYIFPYFSVILPRFAESVWGKTVDSRVTSLKGIIYVGISDSCCRKM